jgi:hypothetical protein
MSTYTDVPGLRGNEVRDLYAEGDRWLAGEVLHR